MQPSSGVLEAERNVSQTQTQLDLVLEQSTSFVLADPMYEIADDIDCGGFWTRPVHQTYEGRKKLLRKDSGKGAGKVNGPNKESASR